MSKSSNIGPDKYFKYIGDPKRLNSNPPIILNNEDVYEFTIDGEFIDIIIFRFSKVGFRELKVFSRTVLNINKCNKIFPKLFKEYIANVN